LLQLDDGTRKHAHHRRIRRRAGKPESAEEQHRVETIPGVPVDGKCFLTGGKADRGGGESAYVSDRTERIGVNEALFREVNERIGRLQVDLGEPSTFEIVCECGVASCTERFPITSDEYRALREDVHRFAVVPGHEWLELERIVERHADYVVVEKTDPDAAEIAEKTA
jgi:hypothetical protein